MERMSFEEIKQTELNILVQISKFCQENNLIYFIALGTLIGAVRHKGFIPWDDDIDIQMPREDYNKMIKIFNEKKEQEYLELVSPYDKKAHHSFVKIVDNRTIKLEDGMKYDKGNLGVDIDIFPLDGGPDREKEYNRLYDKLHFLYIMFAYCERNSTSIADKIISFLISKIWGGKINILKKAEELHRKYKYDSCKFVSTIESVYNEKKSSRIPKQYYSQTVLLEFEGYMFSAPIGYHEILTIVYGDYMKLPAESERVTHHKNKCYKNLEIQGYPLESDLK